VRRDGLHHRRIRADDGCWNAADGCSRAAALPEGAGVGRADATTRRQLAHRGWLFAIVTEEIYVSGCELVHDGCRDAPVVCELAGIAREDPDDGCEGAAIDRRNVAVAWEGAAVGCRGAAAGCADTAYG
jgi:hypothetical protein